eukprot:TRINITY_DN21470_c1_g1_i1.p1 TRINITY_DN21470_c1_g1~~TRINITY_DN21470_c1_g1_i1.p1  ORF type:complete len:593 (+),score=141.09 TRINITY_DN21470_c1_g1_i1:55-1833(+)
MDGPASFALAGADASASPKASELEEIHRKYYGALERRLEDWLLAQESMLERVLSQKLASMDMPMPLQNAEPLSDDNVDNAGECVEADVDDEVAEVKELKAHLITTPSGREVFESENLTERTWLQEKQKTLQTMVSGRTAKSPVDLFAEYNPWSNKKMFEGLAMEGISSILIFLSSAFLGFQMDFESLDKAPADGSIPFYFYVINHIFAYLFLLELLLRMTSQRLSFFNCSNMWNYLDMFIVITGLWETILDMVMWWGPSNAGGVSLGRANARLVRMMRILRIARLARVLRVVGMFRGLRILVQSILCTLKALMWSMVLLFLIIYVFAILFTQAAAEYALLRVQSADDPPDEVYDLLQKYYGTLSKSVLSLFMAVSNGMSWEPLCWCLSQVSAIWLFFFMIFICFVYFAVLNVVTGIFCQSAIDNAQQDLDLIIHGQMAAKNMYITRVKQLFQGIDADRSGMITLEEFHECLLNGRLEAFFDAIDMDTTNMWKLYKLLDQENTGVISIEDFVDGCLRLRGQATRIDVEVMMGEAKRGTQQVNETVTDVANRLSGLEDQFQKMKRNSLRTSRRSRPSTGSGGKPAICAEGKHEL